MRTLDKLLVVPGILLDFYIQKTQSPDYSSLIYDHSGSLLPIVWGTLFLNVADDLISKERNFDDYSIPLCLTMGMSAFELFQMNNPGVYETNDIYAALIGGVTAIVLNKVSKKIDSLDIKGYLENKFYEKFIKK